MHEIFWRLSQGFRQMHSVSKNKPSDALKMKIAEIHKNRRKKNPKKNLLYVEVPESKSYLDTATLPMILTVVGTALATKLMMMYDDTKSQERLERRIKNAPAGQGTVRMLTPEEWEAIKDLPPTTPFESKFARPKARIRTGEPLHLEDVKDWTVDVFADAITRAEETVRRRVSK